MRKNIFLVFIRTFCTFSAIIVIGNLDPASLTNYEIFISCTLVKNTNTKDTYLIWCQDVFCDDIIRFALPVIRTEEASTLFSKRFSNLRPSRLHHLRFCSFFCIKKLSKLNQPILNDYAKDKDYLHS